MKFATAIIDPPWDYRAPKRTNEGGSLSKQSGYASEVYRTLSVDDLSRLPVGEVVSDIVLVWTTGPMMPKAISLVDAWGFEFITLIYWLKSSSSSMPHENFDGEVTFKRHMGVGYWFRGDIEPVVVAKRKGTPSYRTGRRSTFIHPVLGHSRKPDFLHELAEHVFPGPYLELFARRRRDGWTCLGDGIDGRDIREAMSHEMSNLPRDGHAPRPPNIQSRR